MRFQMAIMVVVTRWGSPEQRSDGPASPEVKEASSLSKNHLSDKCDGLDGVIWGQALHARPERTGEFLPLVVAMIHEIQHRALLPEFLK
jgi:hypothetical protein